MSTYFLEEEQLRHGEDIDNTALIKLPGSNGKFLKSKISPIPVVTCHQKLPFSCCGCQS